MSTIVTGIITRALQFLVGVIAPKVETALSGPFGTLLGVALNTDYAKNLEASVETKIADGAWSELVKIEDDCKAWVQTEFKNHPAVAAFVKAVAPPPPINFNLTDAQLVAIQAAIADGSLNARLGLS